jgi:hypothetical protein
MHKKLFPDIYEFSVPFNDLTISFERIEISSGYPKGQSPPRFIELFEEVKSESQKYFHAKGGYRIFNKVSSESKSNQLLFEEKSFQTGKIINVQMKHAESLAVFVCTIGSGMENWVNQLLQTDDYFKGYLVDTFASELVDAAMDVIQSQLEEGMEKQGLKITNRFSPGYCGWLVSEQHKLFSLFPKNFCGITLTNSALMIPLKSISGIIGIGRTIKKKAYPCKFCDMQNCVYRRNSA